jgi:hypothetical protein
MNLQNPYPVAPRIILTTSTPVASPSVKGGEKVASPTARAEAIRVQRMREDARRPISVNLAETIALSHKLMQFAGAARRG